MKNKPQNKVKITTTSTRNVYQNNSTGTSGNNKDFSPGTLLNNRKQRKFTVKKIMQENSSLSSRKAVKHTKREYRKAQKNYRTRVKKQDNLKKALQASSESASGKTPQEVREKTFSNVTLQKEAEKAAIETKDAKEVLKARKEVYKKTKKADPSSVSKDAKRQAVSAVKHKGEETLGQQDILQEAMKARQDSRTRTNIYQTSKHLVGNANRMNMKLAKGTYGLSNRSYNYFRGKGFQKTPEDYSKMKQAAKKIRNFRHKLKSSQVGKAAKHTSNFFKSFVQVINNPFKARNLAIIGGLIMFITTIFMFISIATPFPIQQDEFQLTESWLHMTKVDADRSDDTYSFYTPFDEVMFYMNYNYEDYSTSDFMTILGNKQYGDYMNGIWETMNDTSKDDYKFTSMYDLAKDKKSKYYMDSEDFEEMKENAEEYGYSTLDGQLEFPFKTENMPIKRRFGFEVNNGKVEQFSSIETETTEGLDIVAPMSGTVKWHEDQNKVIITETEEEHGARLILTGINSKRQETGSEVKEGELIGKATGTTLTISYEKYSGDMKKMLRVNPAFYFPKVTYQQKTAVSEPFDVEGGELENARFLYSKLTELGYKPEGIAAMLGNFSVESGINPKRAEGDYLNPPIGASANSWDDPAWLAIGGMQIYGRYPNIAHRGLGLGQWTDTADGGTRHTLLVNFAKEKKKKWYSLGLQLDFMMNGDVPAYRTIFKSTMDGSAGNGVAELTRYFLVRWEGNPGDKLAARVAAAEKWYAYFKANPNSDPGGSTGKYILPLNPPNISSGFGWRSMGDYHRGLDFAHPQGTPIKAIDDGTVITAEFHYSWGNHVRVKHDNGQTSLYAHCVSLNVKVGDKLKQGDIVGLVGNTGNSFGAHLHLEISKSTDLSVGSLLDPAVVLGINK